MIVRWCCAGVHTWVHTHTHHTCTHMTHTTHTYTHIHTHTHTHTPHTHQQHYLFSLQLGTCRYTQVQLFKNWHEGDYLLLIRTCTFCIFIMYTICTIIMCINVYVMCTFHILVLGQPHTVHIGVPHSKEIISITGHSNTFADHRKQLLVNWYPLAISR